MNPFQLNCAGKFSETSTTTMYYGMCSSVIFDWKTIKCESCDGSVQYATTNQSVTDENNRIFYEYYQWRVSAIGRPHYQKKRILLSKENNLDTIDTKLIINVDCIAGIPLAGLMSTATAEEIKKYEQLALIIDRCNEFHRRIVSKIIDLATTLFGRGSPASLYTELIEIGELTRSTVLLGVDQPQLKDALGSFAKSITGTLADAEKMHLKMRYKDLD